MGGFRRCQQQPLMCIWFLDIPSCCKGTSCFPLHGKQSIWVESFTLSGDQIILIPGAFRSWGSFNLPVLKSASQFYFITIYSGQRKLFVWIWMRCVIQQSLLSCLASWMTTTRVCAQKSNQIQISSPPTTVIYFIHLWKDFSKLSQFSLLMETAGYFPDEEG